MSSSTPEKRPVRVTILSQSYTLLTAGDPREVEDLAHYLDELMLSIAAKSPNADSTRIAVLACMHLADRLHGLEQDLNRLKERVDRKSEEFAGLLEQVLEGGTMIKACGLLALMGGLLWPASNGYRAQIEEWRRQREAGLKADGGWLTVTGLFWLHEGENSIESEPALKGCTFALRTGKVTFRMGGQTRDLKPDTAGNPDVVKLGSLTAFVIERGGRYGIRVKDNNSRLRKEFTGLHYFPVSEDYRITTHLIPDARKIPIPNILGQIMDTPSPGYVEFEIHGQKLRLTPVEESPGELSFIFRDLTSGKETYGSGRFLDTVLEKNGGVVLDFNKAYNPPCAFTPYATCPLPPKENRLAVRIEAGELKYGSH